MKSWVSSAFSETNCNAVKKETTKTSTRSLKTAKNSFDSSVPICKFTDKSSSIGLTKNLSSLAAKYKPKNRSELIVNKSKVEQLGQVLDNVISKSKGTVVILEGPSGCGKTVIIFYPHNLIFCLSI